MRVSPACRFWMYDFALPRGTDLCQLRRLLLETTYTTMTAVMKRAHLLGAWGGSGLKKKSLAISSVLWDGMRSWGSGFYHKSCCLNHVSAMLPELMELRHTDGFYGALGALKSLDSSWLVLRCDGVQVALEGSIVSQPREHKSRSLIRRRFLFAESLLPGG